MSASLEAQDGTGAPTTHDVAASSHSAREGCGSARQRGSTLSLDTPVGTRVLVALSPEVAFYTVTATEPEVADGVLVVRCRGITRPISALACEVMS